MAGPRVLVVGDGLVGMSAVLALAQKPVSMTWVGPQIGKRMLRPDHRSIVLNAVSQSVLNTLGVWNGLDACATPIKKVVVSDRGRWGKCRFSAEEAQLPALGYVVPAHALLAALQQAAENLSCEIVCGKVSGIEASKKGIHHVQIKQDQLTKSWQGDVVLAADGLNSPIRQMQGLEIEKKDYQQTAFTCQVEFAQGHENIAYERFTRHGPIAMLPRQDGSVGVVWVVRAEDAKALAQLSDQAFLRALQEAFGTKLGLMMSVTPRQQYPLGLAWMDSPVSRGVVYLGNAAQTLHPVMGQGFNLGLRDVMDWVSLCERLKWQNIGGTAALLSYARHRAGDRNQVMRFSDQVVTQFSHGVWPLTMGRNMALGLVDLLPSAKRAVARLSMGELMGELR